MWCLFKHCNIISIYIEQINLYENFLWKLHILSNLISVSGKCAPKCTKVVYEFRLIFSPSVCIHITFNKTLPRVALEPCICRIFVKNHLTDLVSVLKWEPFFSFEQNRWTLAFALRLVWFGLAYGISTFFRLFNKKFCYFH